MAFNNFYSGFENQVFFEKKILSQHIYGKHYIRHSFLPTVAQIDNSVTFSNLVFAKPVFLGFSVYEKSFIFKHKFNKHFTLTSFLNKSNLTNLPTCLSLYKILNILQLNSSSQIVKQMFLVSPIKGGYIVYSIGLKGFLPFSHILWLQSSTFFYLKQQRTLGQVLFLSSLHHMSHSHILFKLPIYRIKLKIYSRFTIKFSGKIIKKRRFQKAKLKAVFLGIEPELIRELNVWRRNFYKLKRAIKRAEKQAEWEARKAANKIKQDLWQKNNYNRNNKNKINPWKTLNYNKVLRKKQN